MADSSSIEDTGAIRKDSHYLNDDSPAVLDVTDISFSDNVDTTMDHRASPSSSLSSDDWEQIEDIIRPEEEQGVNMSVLTDALEDDGIQQDLDKLEQIAEDIQHNFDILKPVEDNMQQNWANMESIEEALTSIEETLKPMEVAQQPIKEAQEPIDLAHEPTERAQQPMKELLEPTMEAHKPIEVALKPVVQAQDPIKELQEPTTEVQKPIDLAHEPTEGAHEPTEGAKQPMTELLEPTMEAHKPTAKALKPIEMALEQRNKIIPAKNTQFVTPKALDTAIYFGTYLMHSGRKRVPIPEKLLPLTSANQSEMGKYVWRNDDPFLGEQRVYIMYYPAKTVRDVDSIFHRGGLNDKAHGILGPGLYVFSDLEMAEKHGRFIFKLFVYPGKAFKMKSQQTCKENIGWKHQGFDSAWVAPNDMWTTDGEPIHGNLCLKHKRSVKILGLCRGSDFLPTTGMYRMKPPIVDGATFCSIHFPHELRLLNKFLPNKLRSFLQDLDVLSDRLRAGSFGWKIIHDKDLPLGVAMHIMAVCHSELADAIEGLWHDEIKSLLRQCVIAKVVVLIEEAKLIEQFKHEIEAECPNEETDIARNYKLEPTPSVPKRSAPEPDFYCPTEPFTYLKPRVTYNSLLDPRSKSRRYPRTSDMIQMGILNFGDDRTSSPLDGAAVAHHQWSAFLKPIKASETPSEDIQKVLLGPRKKYSAESEKELRLRNGAASKAFTKPILAPSENPQDQEPKLDGFSIYEDIMAQFDKPISAPKPKRKKPELQFELELDVPSASSIDYESNDDMSSLSSYSPSEEEADLQNELAAASLVYSKSLPLPIPVPQSARTCNMGLQGLYIQHGATYVSSRAFLNCNPTPKKSDTFKLDPQEREIELNTLNAHRDVELISAQRRLAEAAELDEEESESYDSDDPLYIHGDSDSESKSESESETDSETDPEDDILKKADDYQWEDVE